MFQVVLVYKYYECTMHYTLQSQLNRNNMILNKQMSINISIKFSFDNWQNKRGLVISTASETARVIELLRRHVHTRNYGVHKLYTVYRSVCAVLGLPGVRF